jgi:hypothetical protein
MGPHGPGRLKCIASGLIHTQKMTAHTLARHTRVSATGGPGTRAPSLCRVRHRLGARGGVPDHEMFGEI